MEGDIKYLRYELEHKNNTIDRLLDVLSKATYQEKRTDTYNQNVDVYNDNVSTYNSTPLKNRNNVTTRRKRKLSTSEHSNFEEIESSRINVGDGSESVLSHIDNVTTRKKKKSTPAHHSNIARQVHEGTIINS